MNLKQFLRPNKEKIIIFIILIAAFFISVEVASRFTLFCPQVVGISCKQSLIVDVSKFIVNILIAPIFVLDFLRLLSVESLEVFIFASLLDGLYLYLLAALVGNLLDRRKHKKKKN